MIVHTGYDDGEVLFHHRSPGDDDEDTGIKLMIDLLPLWFLHTCRSSMAVCSDQQSIRAVHLDLVQTSEGSEG